MTLLEQIKQLEEKVARLEDMNKQYLDALQEQDSKHLAHINQLNNSFTEAIRPHVPAPLRPLLSKLKKYGVRLIKEMDK